MMAFIAYCEECGAKHEVESYDTGCMCGGNLIPRHEMSERQKRNYESAWQEQING